MSDHLAGKKHAEMAEEHEGAFQPSVTFIPERVKELRCEQSGLCWRPSPDWKSICINPLAHTGLCGWEPRWSQVGLLIDGVDFIPQDLIERYPLFAVPPGVTVEAVYAYTEGTDRD